MRRSFLKIKYLLPILILLLLLTALAVPVSADEYIANSVLGTQRISTTFEVDRKIEDFKEAGNLANPLDLFIDRNDYLYLLDSNNARIIVFNPNDKVDRIISGSFGKDNKPMNKPEGLFVDDIGDIFIADTQNARILHLDKNGRFIEEFFEPTATTYDKTYPFKPTKIAVDSFGRMYITNYTDFHGLILMDGSNQFLGYIASTKIKTSFIDKFIRVFASDAQREQIAREVPAYFSNFLMKENFLYATSYWSNSEQICKLTPAGGNIFPLGFYGEKNESTQFNYKPAFVDIAVDNDGIVYAADFVTGKIYVYDNEGQNLAIFGGLGTVTGCFDSISSIAVNSKGELYVLDRVTNVIQIFKPTVLMKNIISGTTLFYNGKYKETTVPWHNVLSLDTTNYLANVGLAKTAYKEGNFNVAMGLYKNSLEPKGYSDVFYDYRLNLFRSNFMLIVGIGLTAVILLLILLTKLKRRADEIAAETITVSSRRLGIKGHAAVSLLMFFHPLDGFYGIKKNRKKLTILTPIILLIVFIAVRIIYIYTVHFPLSDVVAIYNDFWGQVGFMILPLVTFLIVGQIIISLSDGKQTYLEMLTASMYAFLPYIVLILPLSAFSHLLCIKEVGLFSTLSSGLWIWCFCLLLLSVKTMNEYSFGKLVWTVIKVLFGMLCFWMICVILYVVVYQSVNLISSIYEEFMIRKYK